MKNNFSILLVLLFAIMLLPAKAQNKGEKFGVRAGYQSASWHKDGSEVAGTDPLNSFYAGLFKDNKILPALHFGIGAEYFQNGYSLSSASKRVLHYISIPLYLKAKIGPVFALGGFGVNFKVAEKIYSNNVAANPTDEEKSNTVDFPALLGLGAKISIFTIEARYHYGLAEVKDGAHNQYFQIGAGISF
jgi:hypothetical protein